MFQILTPTCSATGSYSTATANFHRCYNIYSLILPTAHSISCFQTKQPNKTRNECVPLALMKERKKEFKMSSIYKVDITRPVLVTEY